MSSTGRQRKANKDTRSAFYDLLLGFAYTGFGYFSVPPDIDQPAGADDLYSLQDGWTDGEATRMDDRGHVPKRKAVPWPSRSISILFRGRRP